VGQRFPLFLETRGAWFRFSDNLFCIPFHTGCSFVIVVIFIRLPGNYTR
jgi:hypothetical protein